MKKRIIQTITNTLDENRKLIKTAVHEAFRLTPDAGMMLVNKITQETFTGAVTVSPESEVDKYIEQQIPEDED